MENDPQVAPLSASQHSTSQGLFVVPEAAQGSEHGCEAVSLQQLCTNAAQQRLQPSTVCNTLSVRCDGAERTRAVGNTACLTRVHTSS